MKTLELIPRDKDVVFNKSDLERLYTFERFPVFMSCTDQLQADDIVCDMNWWISKSSGMIQLNPLLPLDVVYQDSHGSGCIGALWRNHHSTFAKFISKFSPQSVLEIGGAHGILADNYLLDREIFWTIIEPNPTPSLNSRAKFIKGFFNASFFTDENYDTIVHSHVFEHIYDPHVFMSDISNFMRDGAKLIFSIPNMEVMLRRHYTNCINFEHTLFLSEPYIEYFLSQYGFKVLEKEYFLEDHSIFYAAEKDSRQVKKKLDVDLYQKNKEIYLKYIKFHNDLITKINKQIESIDQPVYLFSAHVFSQYLISFGLNVKKIDCILDNDKNKQGKRLYGTPLTVSSPHILREIKNPTVILTAGVYTHEIKTDILTNINSGCKFI